jgi:hypothetical protein
MKTKKLATLLMFMLVSCAPAITVVPTSITLTQTATFILTPKSIATITLQPTITETESAQVKYYEFFPSPDGKRILRGIEAPDTNSFDVLHDGKVEWSISLNNPDLLNAHYRPFFWSNNGKYLYLEIHESMDGGFGAFYTGSGVSRFDLETGSITEIIPANGMFALAASPDQSQIAYINENENPIAIKSYNLNTHSEKKLLVVDKKYAQVGSLGWSPKMDKLIFMTMETKDEQISDYSFGIFVLDLSSLKTSSIIENFGSWLSFESWNDKAQVFYTDWQDTVWQLDLNSKAFSSKGQATQNP